MKFLALMHLLSKFAEKSEIAKFILTKNEAAIASLCYWRSETVDKILV